MPSKSKPKYPPGLRSLLRAFRGHYEDLKFRNVMESLFERGHWLEDHRRYADTIPWEDLPTFKKFTEWLDKGKSKMSPYGKTLMVEAPMKPRKSPYVKIPVTFVMRYSGTVPATDRVVCTGDVSLATSVVNKLKGTPYLAQRIQAEIAGASDRGELKFYTVGRECEYPVMDYFSRTAKSPASITLDYVSKVCCTDPIAVGQVVQELLLDANST